jgi:hypothetical protein
LSSPGDDVAALGYPAVFIGSIAWPGCVYGNRYA